MKYFSGIDSLPKGRSTSNLTNGCLCLEGGAFRGVYTNGVLDCLMELGISMQTVIGVSAGALNGFNYVAGHIGRSARLNLYYRNDGRYVGLPAFIENKGVVGFDFIFNEFADIEPFDMDRFMRKDQRFIAVSTDVLSGKTQYFEKGIVEDIFLAIKASASMQYVSKMVPIEDKLCLDGACSVSIPYKWAVDNNFSKIIVVRTRDKSFRKEIKASNGPNRMYKKYPEFNSLLRNGAERYNNECDELDKLEKEGKIFVLGPSSPVKVSKLEKNVEKLGELYYQGYYDTLKVKDEIINYLGEDNIQSIKLPNFITQ